MPTGRDCYCVEGRQCDSLIESEEAATEEVVDFLAIRYSLKIEDVNFEAKERYRRCADFYKALRSKMRSLPGSGAIAHSVVPPKSVLQKYRRFISIDYKSLLTEILAEYKIKMTGLEGGHPGGGGFTCCLAFECLGHDTNLEWLIEETCSAMDVGEQRMAKRVIMSLKAAYNFDVVDASYYRMRYAEVDCSCQRERYLKEKEEVLGVRAELHLSYDCITPTGAESQIGSSSCPPPPHKKRKTLRISTSFPPKKSVKVGEDLSSIFKARALE